MKKKVNIQNTHQSCSVLQTAGPLPAFVLLDLISPDPIVCLFVLASSSSSTTQSPHKSLKTKASSLDVSAVCLLGWVLLCSQGFTLAGILLPQPLRVLGWQRVLAPISTFLSKNVPSLATSCKLSCHYLIHAVPVLGFLFTLQYSVVWLLTFTGRAPPKLSASSEWLNPMGAQALLPLQAQTDSEVPCKPLLCLHFLPFPNSLLFFPAHRLVFICCHSSS